MAMNRSDQQRLDPSWDSFGRDALADRRKRLADLADLTFPHALRFSVRSGLIEELARGASEPDELATSLGVDASSLERLLRLLQTEEVVRFHAGSWTLGSAGELLRADGPGTMHDQLADTPYNRLIDEARRELPRALRTGRPTIGTGRAWEAIRGAPDGGAAFDSLMRGRAADIAPALMARLHGDIETIVDIGCGPGAFITAALARFPKARAVGIDITEPDLTEMDTLDARGRFEFIQGDMFEIALPEDASLYMLCSVLHDWNDDQALQLMTRISRAMATNSKLLLLERVLPDQADQVPSISVLRLDLDMLVAFGGRERSTRELIELASSAQLQVESTWVVGDDYVAVLLELPETEA